MAELAKQIENKVVDEGLETGAQNLTEERIEKVINKVLKEESGARLKAYVDTCIHCGLCSEACHYYLSHDKDPAYSPVGKVKQTIWEMIKKKGKVSAQFIKRASEIASTECNVCKRCARYCPFGIDIAYMMLTVRRICHLLGVTPLYIQNTAHSHAATLNQMWVKDDEWIDTLQWQEEEAQAEIPTLRIPLEKEGADIMYSVIGPEPKFQAQLIYQTAVLMDVAGVNWTMPATPGWDNSDMAMYTGDNEIMGRVKRAHFETAARLRVKRIVMGECGHAFRSVYDMGNRWLGWRMPPIPIVDRIRKPVLNILFFAKERELKREPTDVSNFAYDVAAGIESKIKAEGIVLECNFADALGEVKMDAGVVRLALINILENALDACVEDTAKKSHKIVFSVKPDDKQIVFEIRDDGTGMDRETRESLFTLFFSSKGNKGTGLGLFIANKIIE